MRHTISVSGTNQIKNQRIHCKKLPNFQQDCIVKIQQSTNKLYAIYTPNITSQQSQLSLTYLKLNNIQQSLATMTKVPTPRIQKLIQIQLSQMDYELVSNNFGLLQRSFLDQVNIIWPQGRIGLYYNQSNYVVLMPKCKQLSLVDPYAAISFMIKQQQGSKKIQESNINNDEQQQQEQFDDKVLVLGHIITLQDYNNKSTNRYGYDNSLYLSVKQFNNLSKWRQGNNNNSIANDKNNNNNSRQFYCLVQPLIPFLTNPTFEQYQQYKKLQSTNKLPQLKPILVKISAKQSQNQRQKQLKQQQQQNNITSSSSSTDKHNIVFECSQICRLSLKVPQKLILTQQSLLYNQQFQTISLQMFMKQLSTKKYQIHLQLYHHNNTNMRRNNHQNINTNRQKQMFIEQFIRQIKTKRQFIFLQNYHPFIIYDKVCGLVVSKLTINNSKRAYQTINRFLLIKDISVADHNNEEQNNQHTMMIRQTLQPNVLVSQQLQQSKVIQWLPIIKQLKDYDYLLKRSQQQYTNNNNNNNDKEQNNNKSIDNNKFNIIFETCYKNQLSQLLQYLDQQLYSQSQQQQSLSSNKLLITTYSSNGKTYLHTYLNSIINHNNSNQSQYYRSWYIDCRTLIHPNNNINSIKQYLDTFITLSPYKLIFFDNIDSLIPLIQQGDQMRQKQKISAHILGNHLFQLISNNNKIPIFTAKSQANIYPIFKFDKIIKLKNPNRQLRLEIINQLFMKTYSNNNKNNNKQWIEQFVDKTQSFSLGSFAHYLISQQIPIKKQSKRKNDFSKIVGLKQAKRIIRSVIQKPNKFGFIFDKVKIKVPRGILLYGATGNGKTALGSAVQDQFPMKYFTVKGSDILSKYIGGSQTAVREIFEKALSVAPSIIFFDQFQSIVPRRNSSGTGVTDRVVNQFLCYLDGVSSTTGVFIIAASSRPDLIDPALLRPGRIDSHIYLQYPTQTQRAQLLSLFNNSINLSIQQEHFIQSTTNYSYSDLIGLLKQLRIKKSSLLLKQKQNPSIEQFKQISPQLFQQTIRSYRKGTDIQQQRAQNQLYQNFKLGKGPQIKKQKFIQM